MYGNFANAHGMYVFTIESFGLHGTTSIRGWWAITDDAQFPIEVVTTRALVERERAEVLELLEDLGLRGAPRWLVM